MEKYKKQKEFVNKRYLLVINIAITNINNKVLESITI